LGNKKAALVRERPWVENLVLGGFAMFSALALAFGTSTVMFFPHCLEFRFIELAVVVGIGRFKTSFGFLGVFPVGNELCQRDGAVVIGVTVVLTVVLPIAFGVRQAGAKSQGNP
jgi:hypothetical protein